MATRARAEAERCLCMAEKLLVAGDLPGCRRSVLRARQLDPKIPSAEGLLAVADVLLAGERRINNNQMDWYSILQLEPSSTIPSSLQSNYDRLLRLLHPDNNRSTGADPAFRLVVDAWSVLSDHSKRSLYHQSLNLPFDLNKSAPPPLPSDSPDPPFWTSCPFCCHLFQFQKPYENLRLRCPTCRRPFSAAPLPSLPPIVPGLDAYYCSWAFFPLGLSGPNSKFSPFDSTSPSWNPFFPVFGPPDSSPKFTDPSNGPATTSKHDDLGADQQPPLLAVPISVRPPKTKQVAMRVKKKAFRKPPQDCEVERISSSDSDVRELSDGDDGENREAASGIRDPKSRGRSHSERADCDGGVPAGEGSGQGDGNLEVDSVDIPSLMNYFGAKDVEMDPPFNEFGEWDK